MAVPRFAFLNLCGHPRGEFMLGRLVCAGFVPTLVIEEESSLAVKSRSVLERDLGEHQIGPTLAVLSDCIPKSSRLFVANHNDEACRAALIASDVELVVLGDCRILKPSIFTVPRLGSINVHPGYLPHVRGNSPSIWAIVKDLPLGCSSHLVTAGIDEGPLIARRQLDVTSVGSYSELLVRINELCGELIVAALAELEEVGTLSPVEQNSLPGGADAPRTFRYAPPEIKELAIQKIASGALRLG